MWAVRMRGLPSVARVIVCLALCAPALADDALPRSVLVIDQFELASPASAAVHASFRAHLRAHAGSPISLYVENLDLGRFGGSSFTETVLAYFGEKYRGKPIG